MDEEQLRDIFEDRDLKFTKKKAKELQVELKENYDSYKWIWKNVLRKLWRNGLKINSKNRNFRGNHYV